MKSNLVRSLFLTITLALASGCGAAAVAPFVAAGIDTVELASLMDPTNEVLPDSEDKDELLAVYDSPSGQARISVFEGTDLPAGGLTINVIDAADVDDALKGIAPHFAVRMGPDGTVFNKPVRISFLAGEAIYTDDGQLIVPSIEAYTNEAGGAVLLDKIQVEVTADGLIIVHAYANHFSDAAMRAGAGVEISIDKPLSGQEFYLYEDTISTQMTATNKSKNSIRLIPTETVDDTVVVDPFTYDASQIVLGPNQSSQFGVGSGACQTSGRANFTFDVKGDRNVKSTDKITLANSLILFRIHRGIICHGLDTWMTVTFDANTHTTHYVAQVFKNDGATGARTDITFDNSVTYQWSSATVCGIFETPGDDPRNSWNHDDCSAADEAQSSVILTVTYVDPNGRTITRKYKATPARADEGFIVVF